MQQWGAPDVAHARCGYLVTCMGKVLCCHLDSFSGAGHLLNVLIWDCEGPQQATGHFKDY